TGAERLVADPAALGGAAAGPTGQEKARRERVREQAVGIVAYACDSALTLAAFVLAGQVFVADLSTGQAPRAIASRPGAFDPRPDPAGRRVAYPWHGRGRRVAVDTRSD